MTITSWAEPDSEWDLTISVSPEHPRASLAEDVEAAIEKAPARLDGSRVVQMWIEDVQQGDDEIVSSLLAPYRDLLQLRRELPAEPSGLTTRPFEPDRDADEWIQVNNRAFSWHPEQSGMTHGRLAAAMAEDWFDADGFRILELDGRIAGFCWTKVHAGTIPTLGEIYVIAVDPDFHGRGLGGPMTLAGLEWLADQGIGVSNLYVESDNAPALATYERLGFTTHSVNRAYATPST
ncbi:MAG: mycothiol synthase [Acidimicrobiales bacterium]